MEVLRNQIEEVTKVHTFGLYMLSHQLKWYKMLQTFIWLILEKSIIL